MTVESVRTNGLVQILEDRVFFIALVIIVPYLIISSLTIFYLRDIQIFRGHCGLRWLGRFSNWLLFLALDRLIDWIMGLIKVASAKKGTKSLKTTVPEGIAEFLESTDKDELEWKMQTQNGNRTEVVQKMQNPEKKSVQLGRYSMRRKRKSSGDF